jgi:hypothetical protein
MPGFPDVAYEDARQKIVNSAHPFKDGVARDRDDHAKDQLIGILHGRGRRVRQDEEGEKKDGVEIGRAKDFGELAGIAQEGRQGEQREVAAQENEHERHLVDAVGDEDAGGEEHHQGDEPDLGQSAPPVLSCIEGIKRDDESEGRWIENVSRASADDVFADDADGRGARGDVPGFARAQDHGDKQARQNRSAGELPLATHQAKNDCVEQAGDDYGAGQAGGNEPNSFRRRRQGEQNHQDDREKALGRAKELPNRQAGSHCASLVSQIVLMPAK